MPAAEPLNARIVKPGSVRKRVAHHCFAGALTPAHAQRVWTLHSIFLAYAAAWERLCSMC